MPTPTATIFLPYHALDDVILRGTRAAQPAASAVVAGTLYCVTDEGAKVERSSGTTWQVYSPTPGGGGAGTGDVVGPGVATDDAIALYDGTTGKLIQDSGQTISGLTTSITAGILPVDLATETTGTLPLAALPAHHTRHEPGGADAMAVDAAAAVGSLRTLGTGAQQAAPGNDARFAAPSTPTAHATTHQPGGSDAMAVDAVAATGSLRTLGTGANQAAPGNDARFAAGPAAHHVSHEPGGSDALAALSASILTSGTLPDARLSANVPLLNASNVFTGAQQQIGPVATPHLAFMDTAQPANARVFRLIDVAQKLYIEALNDALTTVVATPLILTRTGDAAVGGDLYEQGRATALGHWTDYTPTVTAPSGTVTVNTLYTCRYTRIGNTLILTLFADVTPSATVAYVSWTLPAGVVAAALYQMMPAALTVGLGAGLVQTAPGATVALVLRDINTSGTFAGGTLLRIGFTFPVSLA